MTAATEWPRRWTKHRYGAVLFAFLLAASATGVACVWFMWAFEAVLERRLDGPLRWLAAPVLFVLSVELIRRVAPSADGAGIPQTVFAARHLKPGMERALDPLTSPRTLAVKVAALLLGLWAGASTGREGPTVHVAACVFMTAMLGFRRLTGLEFDRRSAVVAGGAAGLAAAFNTPLAGVTFAIEELSVDYFAGIKDYVLTAIIVAALAAKGLTGEYNYFGRLAQPPAVPLAAIAWIGALGGILGAFFSGSLIRGKRWLDAYRGGWGRALVPAAAALGLLAASAVGGPELQGPGNQVARDLLAGRGGWSASFTAWKMLATLLTYWSGIAGGIFAPCLSMGASMGASVGGWLGAPVSSCALVGMAAFLSGTIQAPMTAFVILFEMTGHHDMLLPVMAASLVAFMAARLSGARHLYRELAENYSYLLDQAAPAGLKEK